MSQKTTLAMDTAMRPLGFTLLELLTVVIILTILVTTAAPTLQQTIQNSRTKAAQVELLGAIEKTRALAVFSGSRSVIRAKDKWHDGWEIFLDKDNDGIPGANEPIIVDKTSLTGVTILGNDKVEKYISFISTGEGRTPNGHTNAGSFIAGTLVICPVAKGRAYKLVLSRGGRTRTENGDGARDCN